MNGSTARLGCRVDPESDVIALDGIVLASRPGLVHYLVNKPAGVITTARDEHRRRTILDLVPGAPRVFPVGRLDAATEGLIIVTNDGDLAQTLSHPSHGVDKEYLVELARPPRLEAIGRLRRGVELDDGMTAPAKVTVEGGRLLHIVIHEGRNRQVRRMCAALDLEILRLARTRIGPITDPRLRPGSWRHLTHDELRSLAAAAQPRPADRKSVV